MFFRDCSILELTRILRDKFPNKYEREVRSIAAGTTRLRGGNNNPHYGVQAAARNLRHIAAHTHGY